MTRRNGNSREDILDAIGRLHVNLARIAVTPLIDLTAAVVLDEEQLVRAFEITKEQLLDAAHAIESSTHRHYPW